jgi:hypothetical protein
MTVVFNLVLHVLLVGSLGLFLAVIVTNAIAEPDPRERILRLAALAVGAMVTLGAQAAGVSYAAFTVDALSGARATSAIAKIAATAVPGLLGAGLGFYIVRTFRRSDRIGMRVLGFVAMLATTAFAAVYAQATQTKGVFLGAAALPNVSFVSGVILCIVFTDNADDSGPAVGASLLQGALARWRGGSDQASTVGFRPGADPFSAGPRDPFAG